MSIGTEIERQQERRKTIAEQREEQGRKMAQYLQRYEPLIRQTLPQHLSGERMTRLALNVCRKTPGLLEATPESFVGGILAMGALGLEIDVAGESWLVPYRDRKKGITEATPIVGYQGWTKLYYQHPLAADLAAERVYEADEFDYEKGTQPFIRHKPSRAKVKDRGEVIAYYGIATLRNGRTRFEVLTPEEVRTLRNGKTGTSGDIADPMGWMERKTVLKQVLKVSPRSLMLAHALEVDERPGGEITKVQLDRMDDDRQHSAPAIEQGEPESDGPNFTQPLVQQGEEPEGWK